MSIINRSPTALQSLLNSVSQGDNPNDLMQAVRPVLSMESFLYMNVPIRNTEVTVNVGTLNLGGPEIPIPPDEVWFVKHVSYICDRPAAGLAGVAVYARYPADPAPNPGECLLATTNAANSAAGDFRSDGLVFWPPVPFEPATVFNAQLTSFFGFTPGAVDVTLKIAAYALKV